MSEKSFERKGEEEGKHPKALGPGSQQMILSLPTIGHSCIRDKCFWCSFNARNLFTHKRQSIMH